MPNCLSPDCLSTSLTFDVSVGADVCTLCGTVASNASEGLEVLGRVLDGDSYENGRSYLGDGGVKYHGVASKGARRVVGGSEASKEEYAETKRVSHLSIWITSWVLWAGRGGMGRLFVREGSLLLSSWEVQARIMRTSTQEGYMLL